MNHSPSFTIDTPLDASIKEALIGDTLKLVRCRLCSGAPTLRLRATLARFPSLWICALLRNDGLMDGHIYR